MLAGGAGHVGDELGVESVAARIEGGILGGGFVEHVGDGLVVALPVGSQVLAHQLDAVLLRVADEDVAGDGFGGNLAEVEDDGHFGHELVHGDGAVHHVGGGEGAVGGELALGVHGDGAEAWLGLGGGRGEGNPSRCGGRRRSG